MIPIVLKDIAENLRPWVLFAVAAGLVSLFAVFKPATPSTREQLQGFLQALALSSSLIFAHTVVISERRRKHLIFLRSLPIDDKEIVRAKFLAVSALVLPLSNIPLVVEFLLGDRSPWISVLAANSLTLLYASSLLFFSICFRNPAFAFLPFYGAAFLLVFGDPPLLTGLGRSVGSGLTEIPIAVAAVFMTLLFYRLAVSAFRRKELEF